MWYLKNIPKIVHFYWGGNRLSYLRYLTIESFHHYNPDWEIRFYYPRNTVKNMTWKTPEQKYEERWDDWFSMIDGSYVQMIEVPFEEPVYQNMSEVHRSDYLRLDLLNRIGGLWADMDILFFRSIDNISVNNPLNVDKKTVLCISGYGHSIGFMMGSEGDTTFGKLAKESLSLFYNADNYQSIGAEMFNKLFPTIESAEGSVNLGMGAVYFYDANWMRFIFENKLPSPIGNPHSVGVHWYAGSKYAGEFLNMTKGGVEPDNSMLGKLIQDYEGHIYKHI